MTLDMWSWWYTDDNAQIEILERKGKFDVLISVLFNM